MSGYCQSCCELEWKTRNWLILTGYQEQPIQQQPKAADRKSHLQFYYILLNTSQQAAGLKNNKMNGHILGPDLVGFCDALFRWLRRVVFGDPM